MKTYRQGDVMFVKVRRLPKGLRKAGTVLEIRGERQGHLHELAGVNVFMPELIQALADPNLTLAVAFVEVPEERTMTHPDHPELKLPPGKYEVRQAREYNPKRIRRVD